MGMIPQSTFYRLDQAKKLAGKIRTSTFTRYVTEVIYREGGISFIGCCRPIIQFSDKKCNSIQQPGYDNILPKMGFNRHFFQPVIFGPLKYQGKQVEDYKTFQQTSHLVRFVRYLRQNIEIGNLLWIQIDQH